MVEEKEVVDERTRQPWPDVVGVKEIRRIVNKGNICAGGHA